MQKNDKNLVCIEKMSQVRVGFYELKMKSLFYVVQTFRTLNTESFEEGIWKQSYVRINKDPLFIKYLCHTFFMPSYE